ncbi:MAG: hypothetical protein JXR03_11725 [Cyclobacteriaceae bacterium]
MTQQDQNIQTKVIREDEIDLMELVKVVWSKRLFIIKIVGIFAVIGLVFAIVAPDEFESSCTLIPEAADSGAGIGGSLGGLAALAGVNIGDAGGASSINPGLYRSVAQSTPFLMALMNEEFYFSNIDKEVTLYQFTSEYQKTGLLWRIISIPYYIIGLMVSSEDSQSLEKESDSNIISLNKQQERVIEHLKSRITVTMDWELSVVSIQVRMQDPKVAAEVALFTQNYIKEYVQKYATSKIVDNLNFVSEQFEIKKKKFESVQYRLAEFRDQHPFIKTFLAKSEEERLQSEYNVAYNVYSQLATQLETVKLKLEEETPVFTILEPISIPSEKSEPKRAIMLLFFLVAGLTIALTLIYLKDFKKII